MSLIGECEDCGTGAQLRYKPGVPLDKQSRPSVCPRCRHRREDLAEQHRQDIDPRR